MTQLIIALLTILALAFAVANSPAKRIQGIEEGIMYRQHNQRLIHWAVRLVTKSFVELNGDIEGSAMGTLLSPGQFIHWMRNKELMLDLIRECAR